MNNASIIIILYAFPLIKRKYLHVFTLHLSSNYCFTDFIISITSIANVFVFPNTPFQLSNTIQTGPPNIR